MQPRIPDLFRSLTKKWAYKAYNWAVPIMLMGPGDQPVLLSGDENGALKTTAGAGSGSPGAVDWGTGSVTTSATGASYVGLATNPVKQVTIFNDSGIDIEVRKVGSGQTPHILMDRSGFGYDLVADASEIEVRRRDLSNIQVTIFYHYQS